MAASGYREVHRPTTVSASYHGAFERLEPVRLEIFQARFLGGGGPVTARCYPARPPERGTKLFVALRG